MAKKLQKKITDIEYIDLRPLTEDQINKLPLFLNLIGIKFICQTSSHIQEDVVNMGLVLAVDHHEKIAYIEPNPNPMQISNC